MGASTIKLSPRQGENTVGSELNDPVIEAGGILVNDAAFQVVSDRIYDVRGLTNIYIELENEGAPANGITYVIQQATRNYPLQTPPDADFVDIDAEAGLASGAKITKNIFRNSVDSNLITAIRIRVKETIGAATANYKGVVSGTQVSF